MNPDVGLSRESSHQPSAMSRAAFLVPGSLATRTGGYEYDDRMIAVGDSLIAALVGYGVDRQRIVVVKPGTDRVPLARGSGAGDGLHLVTIATLNPGKGHAVLFQALARIRDRRWRTTCAGS